MTAPRVKRTVIAAVTMYAALSVAPFTGAASAATNGEWSVSPVSEPGAQVRRSNFHLEVAPGDRVDDALEIVNSTDRRIRFRLFAADAYNTPNGGGFALRGVDDPADDVARWVRLPVVSFIAAPGTTTRVPFTVEVPRDATPGDHVGGIVAMNELPTVSDSGAVRVAVKRAVGVRLYTGVAGPTRPSLVARSLTGRSRLPVLAPMTGRGRATIRYSVENTGNVVLDVTARLHVTDLFGRTVKTFPDRQLRGLLPDQHVDVVQEWSELPVLGLRLQPHLELVSGEVRESGRTSFLAVPWLLVGLGVALILAWRRRRRRQRSRSATAPQTPADDINSTALPVG